MGTYIILGFTYAFAAAVQPGPLQAYLISQTLTNGWRRTLPAALSPLISDGPVILLVLFVLSRLPAHFEQLLQCAGGIFLLLLAWRAFSTWRNRRESQATTDSSVRRGVLKAVVVNLLNPGPYLGWSLVMGPLFLKGWHETPSYGIGLVVAFYATMVATQSGIIIVFGATTRWGPLVSRWFIGASAIGLAIFGGYQLWSGLQMMLKT